MKALDNITINQKYGLVLKEDIEKTNGVISKQKQQIERLQEQLKEANAIIKNMRPFIQGSMQRQTFMRIINYENKWGVK